MDQPPEVPDGPPTDPEDWTDEQWLAWLEATDTEPTDGRETPDATRIGRVTRTAGGQVLGQAMVGLANVLYGAKEDEVVVVAEGSEPEPDEAFTVHLDRDHPERSTVVFRKETEGQ